MAALLEDDYASAVDDSISIEVEDEEESSTPPPQVDLKPLPPPSNIHFLSQILPIPSSSIVHLKANGWKS
jgi:hypothetical protein